MLRCWWLAFLGIPVAGPAQETPYAAALGRLVDAPVLAGARVGVVVIDLAAPAGEPVLARDADCGFMTASNMKLIAVGTALATLGPEFTFTTRLCATAPPQDGVVLGDLVLVGDGDPTLGGRPLADPMVPFVTMARQLAAAGIREVRGRVLGDDDCQAEESLGNGCPGARSWCVNAVK